MWNKFFFLVKYINGRKNMKKLLILFSLILVFVTGCGTRMGTPTKKVEEFLGKYQSMDNTVLAQLDSVISSDKTMSDEQKKEYRGLMEKQYQNLSYKIKSEEINGNNATVVVEVEVYDYATSIAKSKQYYSEHRDEFLDDNDNNTNTDNTNGNGNNNNGNSNNNNNTNGTNNNTNDNGNNTVGDAIDDIIDETAKFIDYKIKQLKDVTAKSKYEIKFYLTKNANDEWVLDDITDIDRQKLHGLYER